MGALADQIEEARNHLAQLERQAKHAICRDLGHDWRMLGGKNAGCGDGCGCSVPVHECARCGDCDYGDNEWAARTVDECADRHEAEERQSGLIRVARRAERDAALTPKEPS